MAQAIAAAASLAAASSETLLLDLLHKSDPKSPQSHLIRHNQT